MTAETFTPQAMIERLVGFDTVSSGSNLALIDFAESYLAAHGVTSRRTTDEAGGKANLFATVGPEIEGGVVLSGHTDVVPVEGQPWDSDPFTVVERDGRLYGRGTSDMKSFLATALALVPEMLAAPLTRPLHLALSYDEEVGCLGVQGLIDDLKANLPPPAMVIIGEPSSMRLVTGHKGVTGFETRVTGKEAHSSQPQRAANAIMAACELVGFLARLAEEKKTEGPFDERFDPPYTSFNVGVIEGGSALNIVPRHAAFEWEYRLIPGDDGAEILARFERFAAQEVLPGLRETAPEAEIVTTPGADVPGLVPEEEGAAEALIRHLTGANTAAAVSYATEGGRFQDAGFSTVVCGPGSIDQAHQPNEFIDIAQVEACADFLLKLIVWARD